MRNPYLLAAIATTLVAAIAVVGWLIYDAVTTAVTPTTSDTSTATSTSATSTPLLSEQVIGQSVQGLPITVHTVGTGPTDLLFVGGIHGGYEWNSSLLAWQMIDHLTANPELVPPNVTVHIIPSLNPDALAEVVGTGGRFTRDMVANPSERVPSARFNANDVDLNRNFACNWAPESTWRGQAVSAGTQAFSEPEAQALRDYVWEIEPAAVAFWHSQANNVYGSACDGGVLGETTTLGSRYATAANYGYVNLFDAYPITGDAEGWLASLGIPAVTVELESASATEWNRNWAGVESWFNHYDAMAR